MSKYHMLDDALTCISELNHLRMNVDHVFTSPPYFQLYDYGVNGQHGLESDIDAYLTNVATVIQSTASLLGEGSCVFVNIGETFNNYSMINTSDDRRTGSNRNRRSLQKGIMEKQPLRIPQLLCDRINTHSNLHLRFEFIWDKVTGGGPASKSDSGTLRHEYIFQFIKWSKRSRMYGQCEPFDHSIVRIPPLKDTKNPCSFPPELPLHFLSHVKPVWTDSKKTVIMDPYGGAHNTGVAAASLGMDYIGIDLKKWS